MFPGTSLAPGGSTSAFGPRPGPGIGRASSWGLLEHGNASRPARPAARSHRRMADGLPPAKVFPLSRYWAEVAAAMARPALTCRRPPPATWPMSKPSRPSPAAQQGSASAGTRPRWRRNRDRSACRRRSPATRGVPWTRSVQASSRPPALAPGESARRRRS